MQNIPWWRIDFGEPEIDGMVASFRNEHLSQGPVTAQFEGEIAKTLGVKWVTATTSGSTALLMSLIAAGIQPNDEVIVPNRTWIATANAVHLLGGKVVSVDVEQNRPVIDVNQIESKITQKTKAIIVVHLNGRSPDMLAVKKLAKSYDLKLIEDAAQAYYSKNQMGFLGCQSFAGCFSLSIAKLISTGQGGFIVSNDEESYQRLQLMRTHGGMDVMNPSFANFGFNFRFSDILAAIGIEQLQKTQVHVEKVISIYKRYLSGLEDHTSIDLIPVNIEQGEVPVYIEVLTPDRLKLVNFLEQKGIQSRVFYPNINQADYLHCEGKFPNSDIYSKNGLYLPCGPGQNDDHIGKVIDAIRAFH